MAQKRGDQQEKTYNFIKKDIHETKGLKNKRRVKEMMVSELLKFAGG